MFQTVFSNQLVNKSFYNQNKGLKYISTGKATRRKKSLPHNQIEAEKIILPISKYHCLFSLYFRRYGIKPFSRDIKKNFYIFLIVLTHNYEIVNISYNYVFEIE